MAVEPAAGGQVRPTWRYGLAALVATAIATGVGAWLGTRPPPDAIEPAAEPVAPVEEAGGGDAPAARAEVDRDALLDRIEATEAERYGEEEAARRRRQRERMLDARLGEAP